MRRFETLAAHAALAAALPFALAVAACSEEPPPAAASPSACCRADAGPFDDDGGRSDGRDVVANDAGKDAERTDGATPLPPECTDDHGAMLVLCVEVDSEDLKTLYADPDDRVEVQASVVMDGVRYRDAELELHGGFARSVDKKSYRLKFDSDHKPAADYFGDGAEAVKRIVLAASWIDETYARAKLLMDLTREQGGLAPRIGHGVLYINGEYQGLYLLTERIDEEWLERNDFNPDGNLYKAESHSADWQIRSDPLKGFSEVTHEDGLAGDLGSFFTALWAAPRTPEGFDSEVESRFERSDWEAWHRVHSFGQNLDTFSKNYYLYHDPDAATGSQDAKFRIVMWDADSSWGRWWNGESRDTDDSAWWGERNAFAERYFGVRSYAERYLEDYQNALDGPLRPAALDKRLNGIVEQVGEEARRDLAHWSRKRDFDDEIDVLRDTFRERHRVLSEAVADEAE